MHSSFLSSALLIDIDAQRGGERKKKCRLMNVWKILSFQHNKKVTRERSSRRIFIAAKMGMKLDGRSPCKAPIGHSEPDKKNPCFATLVEKKLQRVRCALAHTGQEKIPGKR